MEDEGERRCRRLRLVLIACPLQGHMTPMLQLGTYLHSKGFWITIAHSDINKPDPCIYPHFTFFSLSDNLSGPGDFPSFLQFLQALNNNCKPHFQQHLIQIVNSQKGTSSSLSSEKESVVIIHDNLMFFAESVAYDLGLPSIILRSSSAAFFPVYKMIPQLHQQDRYHVQDSLLQELVPELYPLRYKDLPFLRLPIQAALQSVTMMTPKAPPSAFIWNTIEFLEPSALTMIRHQYNVPIFTIGPLQKITLLTTSTGFLKEDTTCISWLDKQAPKSVIYVSLGSLATIDENVLTEMAWSLVNSNQPFLWVVRPGSVHVGEWIEFLPEGLVAELKGRGLVIKWAPQKEVLAHFAVGGFWSHCGWNSTLESLSEGVPMLCQPFGIDQLVNSRYLCYVWKIGIEIVMERGEIEGAIRRILVGKDGEEMRERAKEIQQKIKVATSHNGSSQNSLNELIEFIWSL